ncbi:hypothetical protein H5410_004207 [Solanum commersonii]|uniref:Late blight resistance protein n=1 Tax=Solanum commersonii TaxID=4109 RepID=A0A9J6B7A8_SOLCO|nr:hypothetical protein H5410_004207 [Solanum commersonii]
MSRRPIDSEDIPGFLSSVSKRITHDTHLLDVPFGTTDPRAYYPNYCRPAGVTFTSQCCGGTPPLTQHYIHPGVSPTPTLDETSALAPGQRDRIDRVMIEPDESS